jgi:hypothetical protein
LQIRLTTLQVQIIFGSYVVAVTAEQYSCLFFSLIFLDTLLWVTDCFVCHDTSGAGICYLTTRRPGFNALFDRINGGNDIAVYCIAHGAWVPVTVTGKRSSVMTLVLSCTDSPFLSSITTTRSELLLRHSHHCIRERTLYEHVVSQDAG